MAKQRKRENFFERSVWVLFIVIGVLGILFGVGDMISGIEADPAILISATGKTPAELKAQDPLIYNAMDQQHRRNGKNELMLGLLISVVTLIAFRRGARWAWFTFWLMPISTAITAVSQYVTWQPGESLPPPFYSGSIFTVLTIVWLALSYQKYLSREVE